MTPPPPPDVSWALTKTDVCALIEPLGATWAEFEKWMYGQTVMEHPVTREVLYYPWDVESFAAGIKRGLSPGKIPVTD